MPTRSLLPTLSAISDDLSRVRDQSLPWDATVRAKRTLPSGGQVEAWYLAGFFLRAWATDIGRAVWKKTMIDGLRLASGAEDNKRIPRRRRVDALADDVAHDAGLDPYLARHLELLTKSLTTQPPDARYGGGLVRAAVETHEWLVLLGVLADLPRDPELIPRPETLPSFRKALGALARSVREFSFSLSGVQQAYATDLMTNYRNSTLAFSWMPYCQGDADFDTEDPLFPDKREMAVIRELAERVAREFEGVDGVRVAAIRSVVERIAEAVLQRGYPDFARDIASPGLFAAQDPGGNTLPINVIPGDHSGTCAPLLVAVAQAGRKSSLAKITPLVRQHLTKCNGITNGVIIVSDEWKPGILGDTLADLKLRTAEGKKIVFLLAPQPGSGLVHIPVSLT